MNEHSPVEIEDQCVNPTAVGHIRASSIRKLRQASIGEQQQLSVTNERRPSLTNLSLTYACLL